MVESVTVTGPSFCHYSRYRDYGVSFSRLNDGGAAIPLRDSIKLTRRAAVDVRVIILRSTNADREEGSRSNE